MKFKRFFLIFCIFPVIFSSCDKEYNVIFKNNTVTPVNMTFNGELKIIEPGKKIDFTVDANSEMEYRARTSGKTSEGENIGLEMIWKKIIYINGNNQEVDLDVNENYYFLRMRNNSADTISRVYINYESANQIIADINISNIGLFVDLGYYNVIEGTKIAAGFSSSEEIYIWQEIEFPGDTNQVVKLIYE